MGNMQVAVQELTASDDATAPVAAVDADLEQQFQGESPLMSETSSPSSSDGQAVGSSPLQRERVVLGVALGCASLALLALFAFLGIRQGILNDAQRQEEGVEPSMTLYGMQYASSPTGTESGTGSRSVPVAQRTGVNPLHPVS